MIARGQSAVGTAAGKRRFAKCSARAASGRSRKRASSPSRRGRPSASGFRSTSPRERHMDLKQIALFAWLPFLAADLGGLFGGYLSPFLMKHLRVPLIWSRIAGVVLGAVMMIGPACIGLVASPYQAIALFCVGGFAHQMISVLVNTLSADVFEPGEVGTANGFAGMAAWIGGLLFSLLVGALADSIGYTPLFGALGGVRPDRRHAADDPDARLHARTPAQPGSTARAPPRDLTSKVRHGFAEQSTPLRAYRPRRQPPGTDGGHRTAGSNCSCSPTTSSACSCCPTANCTARAPGRSRRARTTCRSRAATAAT